MGKSFPLFRVRHTPKQVLTCQWEKRSICTFEEVASRRVTRDRHLDPQDWASVHVLTRCVYVTYSYAPRSDVLASNMQY